MKTSLLATGLIVALFVILGTLQEGRIAEASSTRTVLQSKAIELGLPVDGSQPVKSTPGARVAPAQQSVVRQAAKDFAEELFDFVRRIKSYEERGEEPPEEIQREAMAFFQRFLEVDADQMSHLIELIAESTLLEDQEKGEIIRMSFMTLVQSDPRNALALFLQEDAMLKEAVGDREELDRVVQMALSSWSNSDPDAAYAWFQANKNSLSDEARKMGLNAALTGILIDDAGRGMGQVLSLSEDDFQSFANGLGSYRHFRGREKEFLQLLTSEFDVYGDHEPEDDFLKRKMLGDEVVDLLGRHLTQQTGSSATALLSTAELSDGLQEELASSIAERTWNLKDPAHWIPFLEEHLPEEEHDRKLTQTVAAWTQNDFRAAAEWIGEQPEGDLRTLATLSFAETVAPHEPASAAEWAEGLPESEERTDLFRKIHEHWQAVDEEAAESFSERHGL